jgi:uncharacterized protein with FMN-binding domain
MSSRSSASLGKRLLPAFAMTAAASGLVALLDQPSSGSATSASGGATGGVVVLPDQGLVPAATVPPPVSSTLPAVAGQPTPTTTQQPSATTSATASGGACQGKTIDGQTVDTRWGPVQVEAVISPSGLICGIDAIQSPNSHGRSIRINEGALPILHAEVMKAQSANINAVSGATVTSRGYQRSLQSILDGVGG